MLLRANRDASAIARVYITGGASVAPFVQEAVRNRMGSDRADRVLELSGPSASAAYGALRLFSNVREWGDRATVQNKWPDPRTSDDASAVSYDGDGADELADATDKTPVVGASSAGRDVDMPSAWRASTDLERAPSDAAAAAQAPSHPISAVEEPTSGGQRVAARTERPERVGIRTAGRSGAAVGDGTG